MTTGTKVASTPHFQQVRRKYSTYPSQKFRAMTSKYLNSLDSIDMKSADIIMYDRRLKGVYRVCLHADAFYLKKVSGGKVVKSWKIE